MGCNKGFSSEQTFKSDENLRLDMSKRDERFVALYLWTSPQFKELQDTSKDVTRDIASLCVDFVRNHPYEEEYFDWDITRQGTVASARFAPAVQDLTRSLDQYASKHDDVFLRTQDIAAQMIVAYGAWRKSSENRKILQD